MILNKILSFSMKLYKLTKRLIIIKKFLIDLLVTCIELCLLIRSIDFSYSFRYIMKIRSEINKLLIIRYIIEYKKL
jgi:lipid A disaccharide synthetase